MSQQTTTHSVEILGFSERERTLFASIFRLSELRTHRYIEHQGAGYGECIILDANMSNFAEILNQRLTSQPNTLVLVVLDPKSLMVTPHATIHRPIRWADLLLALDNQIRIQTNQNDQLQQELNPDLLANDLELISISDWYDKQQPVVFQTAPAVLVVDSEDTTFLYITAKLAGQPYRVDHAKDAESALDHLTINRYNIVISQVNLPDRSGIDLCRLIKKREDRRRIATILLGDEGNLLYRTRVSMAGCDAYFVKPLQPEKLELVMQKFLPDWRLAE